MDRHQAPTLEKVFLRLCQELEQTEFDELRLSTKTQSLQSISVSHPDSEASGSTNLIKKIPKPKAKVHLSLPSFSNIAALFLKNWITMKRNLPLLFFVFFLPGIVLLINSLTIGLNPKDLPIAVVNFETNCTDKYYQHACEANQLSCYFQDSLNRSDTIHLISYPHASEAV